MKWFIEFFWLFLEIHLIKVILLLAFTLVLEEVSAVHIIIMVLAVLTATARSGVQTVLSGVISLVVAVLTILKMIYQIDYIPQSKFDVSCNVTDVCLKVFIINFSVK